MKNYCFDTEFNAAIVAMNKANQLIGNMEVDDPKNSARAELHHKMQRVSHGILNVARKRDFYSQLDRLVPQTQELVEVTDYIENMRINGKI